MVRFGYFFVGLICLLAGAARAEPQLFGPLALTIKIDQIEIPLSLSGRVDVNSKSGDFNAIGEVTATSTTETLRDRLLAISKKILPARIPTPHCEFWLNKIDSLEIESHDWEFQLKTHAVASMRGCPGLNLEDRGVDLRLAALAAPTDGKRLQFKLVRAPELIFEPARWRTVGMADRSQSEGAHSGYAR